MEKGMRVLHNTEQKSDFLYVYEIGTQVCFPGKPLRCHIFEYSTIHFVMSGSGTFNGQTLNAGQGFYVKEGQFVSYKQDDNDPWEYYWIDVSGLAADEVMKNVGFDQPMGVFDFSNSELIREQFESFFSEDIENVDMRLLMNSYFYKILSLFSMDYYKYMFSSKSVSKAEEHFKKAMLFISNSYSQKITVEDIAQSANVERHYLNKLFKIYSDSSPQVHLLDLRLDKAKNLLRTTSFPIGTIANSVGYDDSLQFSRIFKKKTGVSPTQYRNDPENDLIKDK